VAFPLTQIFTDQYRTAAAEGAIVELKLRLLVDKLPALQKYAHQQKLEDIEEAVAKHFGAALSDEDKERLWVCRQLRNKILHCNFSVARAKLEELGVATHGGSVKKLEIAGLSGVQIAAKLKAAKANVPGEFELVANTKTKEAGSVFGWLLEMGNAGDFLHAADAFRAAAIIVDRLAMESAGKTRV